MTDRLTESEIEVLLARRREDLADCNALGAAEIALLKDIPYTHVTRAVNTGALVSSAGPTVTVKNADWRRWHANGCPTEPVRQRRIG